jgi:hypothetical protein
MKNAGELIAYIIAALWMIFFIRIVWINHKVVKYLKNKVHLENSWVTFGSGRFPSV